MGDRDQAYLASARWLEASGRLVLAACLASSASCGLSYQQRQDRFRAHYLAGCQVRQPSSTARAAQQDTDLRDRTEIDDVIAGSKYEIEQCYLEARELWADLEGLVALEFTVNADGRVEDPGVVMYESTIHEAAVGCCIARIAPSWKFPPPRAGKPFEVEHTFELETDLFRYRFRPTSEVGKPQPASGTEIHHTW